MTCVVCGETGEVMRPLAQDGNGNSWERRRLAGPVRCDRQFQLAGGTPALPGGYAFVFASTVFTHAWLSRYQRMVSRMPSSNLCAGVQPSSRWIFDASMA